MTNRLYLSDFLPDGDAFHVARARYRPGQVLAHHGHDFAEVFWIEAGTGTQLISGSGSEAASRGEADRQKRRLVKGTICLLLPDDEHSIRADGPYGLSLANVAFEWERACAVVQRYGMERPLLPGGIILDSRRLALLSIAFSELESSRRDQLSLDAFLLRLLWCVAESAAERADGVPHWLASATARMNADPSLLSDGVPGLAAACERTADHVNRVCRSQLGITASEYLNRLRLERAEQLLRTTELDVTSIAYDSGFTNLSYFFRLFRTRWGITPRRYRDAARMPVKAR